MSIRSHWWSCVPHLPIGVPYDKDSGREAKKRDHFLCFSPAMVTAVHIRMPNTYNIVCNTLEIINCVHSGRCCTLGRLTDAETRNTAYLGFKFYVVVRCLTWGLWTKLSFSTRAWDALKHLAASPAPHVPHLSCWGRCAYAQPYVDFRNQHLLLSSNIFWPSFWDRDCFSLKLKLTNEQDCLARKFCKCWCLYFCSSEITCACHFSCL